MIIHYINHNFTDWDSQTKHMSRIEKSIFLDLRTMYFGNASKSNGSIDSNDFDLLCYRLSCKTEEEINALKLLLKDQFKKVGKFYRNAEWDQQIKNLDWWYQNQGNKSSNGGNELSNGGNETGNAMSNAERQAKAKQERKNILNALSSIGVNPDKNAPIATLRALFADNFGNGDIAKVVTQISEQVTSQGNTGNETGNGGNAEIRANNHKPETNNHKPETNTNKAKAAGVDSVTAMEWFDEFYDLYPVKKSKGDALKAWQKIFLGDSKTKPVENPQAHFEKIMTGLKLNLEHITAQLNRGYGKHPSTWLNGMGWDDVHEAPEPQNQSRFGTAADPMAVDVVWNQPLRTEPAMSFEEMMAEMNANPHSPVDFLGN